jgi:diguanylate cyclase (GGDEF)-like protein
MRQDAIFESTDGETYRRELADAVPLGEPALSKAVIWLERAAFAGLALVLVCSAAFAIVAANTTSGALREMRSASTLNAAYQDARYAATRTSLARKGRPESDGAEVDRTRLSARAAHQRAVTDAALEHLGVLQRRIIAVGTVLAVLRLVCFSVYIAIIVVYKRRLAEAHRGQVARLQEAALVDHLTDIGNHRAFKECFRRAVARAAHAGETLTLALLDIDEMKLINDRSGHMHGDWVLQSFGRLLAALSPESRAFRLGGDEFAVLLPNWSREEVRAALERLRRYAEDALLGATISVGTAALTGSQCDEDTLQGQADAALYAAKRAGRNRCVCFDATVDEMWMLSPAKVRSLRELIAGDEVRIVFQPIWDVASCTILAYEALARPEWGGPRDVFDLAERVGRAHEIDAVCRRAALRRANELPQGVLLFLKVAPRSLDHGHFDPATFAAEVVTAGLSPSRVVVELTEQSIVTIDVVKKTAKELQRLGFRIALNATGSGHAGLELLSQLCVEVVKIDRGIIVKAMTDRSARGVMAGAIAIAKETGAYVIAEGVEDVGMLDFLCARGWGTLRRRGVQGFLLRSPSAALATAGDVDAATSILRMATRRKPSSRGDGSPAAVFPLGDEPASRTRARVAVADRATSSALD